MRGSLPSSGSPRRRLHAVAQGFVQGVGFRHFVVTHVWKECPNVVGWVKNRYDEAVEVLAEGPENELHILLDFLRKGPRRAMVDHVEETWSDPEGTLGRTFEVTF